MHIIQVQLQEQQHPKNPDPETDSGSGDDAGSESSIYSSGEEDEAQSVPFDSTFGVPEYVIYQLGQAITN